MEIVVGGRVDETEEVKERWLKMWMGGFSVVESWVWVSKSSEQSRT